MKEKEYTQASWVPNPMTPGPAITIDSELCIGCKRCVNACRTDVLLPALKDRKSPCTLACPAGIDIKKQLTLIAKGRYREALMVIKESTPLPLACSRVCPRFCEMKCGRVSIDGPVAINMTKRFVADMDLNQGGPYTPEPKPGTGHKVAIVGGGPAGLSAAYYLALEGHEVTIFEADQKLGGLLRYGVPEFRLPKAVLDKEIESITKMCKEVKTGLRLGTDFTVDSLKKQGYEVVFLTIGAQGVLKLNVTGEDLDGVISGVSFMKKVNSGQAPEIGKKVVIIGGGMVAVDASQCAVRLGAEEVTIVCLETRDSMPAYKEDVQLAEEEGVKILPSWGVESIAKADGKAMNIKLKACISVLDENNRFKPCFDETETKVLEADTVIAAIGQTPDLSVLDGNQFQAGRVIEVDENFATGAPGVFAGGDVVTGPIAVIEASAAGRKAAEAINKYLKGQTVTSVEKPLAGLEGQREVIDRQEYADLDNVARTVMPSLKPEERKHTFDEVALGISEAEVRKEAGRCFTCGQDPVVTYPDECWFCGCCVEVCPVAGAIDLVHPLNQRAGWKRKAMGEFFRIGMKNPPPPTNNKPPSGLE